MTASLDDIHRDPAIVDRAIEARERLDILAGGKVAATLVPNAGPTAEEARQLMRARFAKPDWAFSVGDAMSRDERNARA
jgi:hypothetical protein